MSLALHPYRATVIQDIGPEWKLIEIPLRYGKDPIGPVRSAVDAQVGDRVIVTDMSGSHSPEWLITQFESMIGRGSDGPSGAHTHPIGQIDGLVAALDAKVDDSQLTAYETAATAATKYAPIGHSHAWADITGKPTSFNPSAHSHAWTEITGKPSSFTPSAHTHLWADITDKPSSFTPATHTHAYTSLTGIPSTFAPSSHSHAQSDVTGLTDALAGKAAQSEYAVTKADVDAATYFPYADTIVRRAASGGTRVVTGSHSQDATNVEYVDTYYTSKTTFNNGMAAKSDAPGPWMNLTLGSGVTFDATQTGPSPRARMTALGLQIQGRRLRGPSTPPSRDQVFATIPSALAPPYDILFTVPVQRSIFTNPGANVTMKLKTGTGDIQYVSEPTHVPPATQPTATAQQGLTGGGVSDYITLNNILLAW